MARVPYDDFAALYDAWVDSVPVTGEMREFYVELLSASEGPVVELGVGNGRICVEVARRGRRVIGVDSSTAMLELCRERAEEAGVGGRLELIQADFRDFALAEPAGLIAIPFHSIGHLTAEDDQRRCMETVHGQLRPGGLFVWDHFVFDPDYPVPPKTLNLRADVRDPDGRSRLIWESSTRHVDRQLIDVLVRVEDLDDRGSVDSTRYVRMSMSWIEPTRSRQLLRDSGFEIDNLYGDFRRGPFGEDSGHQVWLARRA